MLIKSIDSQSWIEIERSLLEQEYSCFSIACKVDIGHGQFTAKNTDVHFVNLKQFVDDLDHFILDRNLSPILEGTYGTSLKFYSPSSCSLMVSFTIGDAYCGYIETVDFKTSGTFEIEQEYLGNLLSWFARQI